jgi:hypothetical protein
MKALYDFNPQFDGDLRFSKGDIIQVMKGDNTSPDGWLVGVVNGRRGPFPTNYCELVAEAPRPSESGQILGSRYPPVHVDTKIMTNSLTANANLSEPVNHSGRVVPNSQLSFITVQD